VLGAAVVALLPLVARAEITGPAAPVAALKVGAHAFWPGGYVGQRVVSELPAAQACAVTMCWTFPLTVGTGGHRLRVAIDTPSREDSFEIDLLDPAGVQQATATNSNRFNIEAFIAKPAPGRWTVRVVPRDASYASFRMRAKLEGAPRKAPKHLAPPNLMATPPYEFGFVAPANPLNGLYPPDTANPPLDVLGVHPLSCALDEMVEDGVSRCLRLTTGPRNAGEGPFELHYVPIEHGLGIAQTGPVTQRVYSSDGTFVDRPAGEFVFHKTHGHYHYQDILDYQLYKVLDPRTGRLVRAGSGHKAGFSPADQLFANWSVFEQLEGAYVEGTPSTFGASTFGLSVGWGDVYRWQRPGQYVDFGANTDGRYVVRTVVDIRNHVLESNERDNAGYAYIQVTGEDVRILERGQGLSPWDPHKVVFSDR
jgi:hypothetical protein